MTDSQKNPLVRHVAIGAFAAVILTVPTVWMVAHASDNASAASSSISSSTSASSSTSQPSEGMGMQQGSGLTGGSGASSNSELVNLLQQDSSSYRWAATTTGSQNAASYQLASDVPVMAIGGFNGTDDYPTLDQFKEYVSQGLIHYYIAGGGMGGTQNGGSSAASQIAQWVAQNYEAQTVGNTTIYDLTQN